MLPRKLSTAPIEILGRDLLVTPSLKQRIDDKIGKVVNKLGHDVKVCHVTLRLHRFPSEEHHAHTTKKDSQISEVTVTMKGGNVIRATERTEDMYASIDLMAHRLAQKLKKHNEKSQLYKPLKIGTIAEPLEEYKDVPEKEPFPFDEENLLVELDAKYREQAKVKYFEHSHYRYLLLSCLGIGSFQRGHVGRQAQVFPHASYICRGGRAMLILHRSSVLRFPKQRHK